MILSRALFAASIFLTVAFASYNEQQKMVDDVNKYRTAGGVPRLTMSEYDVTRFYIFLILV
jgi:hypothetical protein